MAAEGTVVGVKDSSGAGELLAQLNLLCDQGDIELYRFLGTVYRIASTRAVGGHGVIPAVGNLVPASAVKAWEAGEQGDVAVANEYLANVIAATKVFRLARGGGPNASVISAMKSALKLMGIIEHDTVTRPLRPLTDEERQHLPAILTELGLDH
jgi:4-hydroxy-tetrahydrodipicolinate synthase